MRIKTKNQMKKYILFIIILFGVLTSHAQTTNCECIIHDAKKVKADSIYTFSNGKSLAICGYREGNPNIFSEFYLNRCDMDSSLGFWDALRDCKVTLENDTLFIREFKLMANGGNREVLANIYTIEKFYFKQGELKRNLIINPELKMYNQESINLVIKKYESTKGEMSEDKIDLAYELFYATISGSKKASEYFKKFDKKFFIPSGAYLEEWQEIQEMLKLWNEYNSVK